MVVLWFALLIIGIGLLLKSTDIFLDEAVDIFSYWRFSPFVIGALVVGVGTSMPELGVGILSALAGDSTLPLGTVMGSNIANIMFILGVSALLAQSMTKLGQHKVVLFLVGISLLLRFFIDNLVLSRLEGLILLVLFVLFLMAELIKGKNSGGEAGSHGGEYQTTLTQAPRASDILRLVGSLMVLLLSAGLIVRMAEIIAAIFEISESFIGLSIIAFGSSMPELTASVMAIKKGQMMLVYGNVLGSNVINTLLVVGSAVLIAPIDDVEDKYLTEMGIISGLSLFLLVAGLIRVWEKKWIQKTLGGCLVIGYLVYLSYAVTRII